MYVPHEYMIKNNKILVELKENIRQRENNFINRTGHFALTIISCHEV